MANSIFSTYSTGENRVTSTILAVFERLSLSTVTRILQILVGDLELSLIKYENQVRGTDSVPDGRIRGIFDYSIETKIVTGDVKEKQIINHCVGLKYDFSKLLVLTPDPVLPEILKGLMEKEPRCANRIIWANFDKMIEGISSVLEESILLLDREKFLLSELRDFIFNEKLTSEDFSKKILVVPAGAAWQVYKKYHVYKCQPNRFFRPSSYMGFYADGEIKKHFPKILGYVENINIQTGDLANVEIFPVNNANKEEIRKKLIKIKESLKPDEWDEESKFIVLSDIDSEETFQNDYPIRNDKTSYSEKPTAFVQKQTYLNLDDLSGKRFTSELEDKS
jgi:hypothetical protein